MLTAGVVGTPQVFAALRRFQGAVPARRTPVRQVAVALNLWADLDQFPDEGRWLDGVRQQVDPLTGTCQCYVEKATFFCVGIWLSKGWWHDHFENGIVFDPAGKAIPVVFQVQNDDVIGLAALGAVNCAEFNLGVASTATLQCFPAGLVPPQHQNRLVIAFFNFPDVEQCLIQTFFGVVAGDDGNPLIAFLATGVEVSLGLLRIALYEGR